MIYSLSVVTVSARDCRDFIVELRNKPQNWTGANLWGAFQPLFGLAANQMIHVHFGEVQAIEHELRTFEQVSQVTTLLFEPTVRPTVHEPRTNEGLYVFRFFDVYNRDVETIANLSNDAWTYFEDTEDYQAIPQALFCEPDLSQPQGKMLLCTWYDGLTSWERSRTPDSRASENFRQRHELTLGTKPYATRLIKI